MPLHPANENRPGLPTFLWRYFTGHHLDGRPRTNATWTKRGTAPGHHVNWWNAKPRLHRMAWRWALVGIPAGWIIAYLNSPSYQINLTVIVTLCALPYLFHNVTHKAVSLLPKHRVVFVSDNVPSEDVDTVLDDISIGEQMEIDPVQEALDESLEGTQNAAKRTRRSS